MTQEPRLAEWSIRWSENEQPVVYDHSQQEDIATVHGTAEAALHRALLIARAPSLRNAVRAAVQVFSAMRDYGNERERATGMDMLPSMEAALQGLDDAHDPSASRG